VELPPPKRESVFFLGRFMKRGMSFDQLWNPWVLRSIRSREPTSGEATIPSRLLDCVNGSRIWLARAHESASRRDRPNPSRLSNPRLEWIPLDFGEPSGILFTL